jgi:hypothetical protein
MLRVMRAPVLVLSLLFLSQCAPNQLEPKFQLPDALVGLWATEGKTTDTGPVILDLQADGSVVRLLPIMDGRPTRLGRFTKIEPEIDHVTKLRLAVDPGVTYKEVVAVPVEFHTINGDQSRIRFLTDFYKIETNKPVSPGEGGFWGPGSGVDISIYPHQTMSSVVELNVHRVDIAEAEHFRAQAQKILSERKAKYAEIDETLRRDQVRQKSYAESLMGGVWVLEKVESRKIGSGILISTEEASQNWLRGETLALADMSAQKIWNFRVEPGQKENTVLIKYADGSAEERTFTSGKLSIGYSFTPVERSGDVLKVSAFNDYRNTHPATYILTYRLHPSAPSKLRPAKKITSELKLDKRRFAAEFQKTVAGDWHLVRSEVVKNGNVTRYENVDPRVSQERRFRLTFDKKMVATNDEEKFEYKVVQTKTGAYQLKTEFYTRPDGLILFNRSENELQLAAPVSENEYKILTYTTLKPSFDEKDFIALHEKRLEELRVHWSNSDEQFLFKQSLLEFERSLSAWSNHPDEEITLPIWISPVLDLSPGKFNYDAFTQKKDQFRYLNHQDRAEIIVLIRSAIE